MDYDLDEDQRALVDGVQAIVRDHDDVPRDFARAFACFGAALRDDLDRGGFLDVGRDMGPLAAALLIVEVAASPLATDIGACALVAALVAPGVAVPGPVALADARHLGRAIRNLPVAKSLLVRDGGDVVVVPVTAVEVAPATTIYAYPYGRLASPLDLTRGERVRGAGDAMAMWQRVALAAEIAGTTARAVAYTIDYVKQRLVLGRAVGAFQAVQHRLAQCHQHAQGMRYLAFRAAFEGDAASAALAACYAQQKVSKIVFDLHQFNGAIGVTNECRLHFWTYRMRALQAEAGGVHEAALDIADGLWGAPERPTSAVG